MAFNNFPYTNFQDLNLGWILAKIKEVIASSAAAVAKAEAVEADVGTYSQRISDAEAEADSARNIANTARGEALNAQSDATSAIAIGRAAQGTANAAMSAANDAQDTADTAVDSAATAERNASVAVQTAELADTKATNALNDYLDVHIAVYQNNPVQADKNVDQILAAVTANKKIRFTADDSRTGDTYVTFEYIINPVEDTNSDIDIQVFFDTSVSSSRLKFLYITFTKRVGTGGVVTYSTIGGDVTFSGGGGGGGSADAVLFTVQSLSSSERAQARANIGAGHYNIGISQDERAITIVDADTGSVNSYTINKPPYKIPLQYRDGVYTTSITGEDFLDHIDNCFIEFNGLHYYQIGVSNSGAHGNAYFACADPSASGKIENDIFDLKLNGTNACTVTRYDKDIALLPTVTSADNGKFLRVVSGAWAAATVPNAESNSFGGV